jgi:transcriptional regulator with XRE-family HTH domain
MNSRKSDPNFIRAYDRGMLRSAFVSLFWGIIIERKKRLGFTLQALAKLLKTNKAEVSRWFNGDPNWTINTIANLANALDVDLQIQAIDRTTGMVFTPAGPLQASVSSQASTIRTAEVRTKAAEDVVVPLRPILIPGGIRPKLNASIFSMAA